MWCKYILVSDPNDIFVDDIEAKQTHRKICKSEVYMLVSCHEVNLHLTTTQVKKWDLLAP